MPDKSMKYIKNNWDKNLSMQDNSDLLRCKYSRRSMTNK
jgi:hypothetical protein